MVQHLQGDLPLVTNEALSMGIVNVLNIPGNKYEGEDLTHVMEYINHNENSSIHDEINCQSIIK